MKGKHHHHFTGGVLLTATALIIAALALSGCAGREIKETGIVTIETYPLPADVFIDGAEQGTAPMTIVLDTGIHLVDAADIGPQFEAPDPVSVAVAPEDRMTLTIRYTDTFLPDDGTPGDGWTRDETAYYGVPGQPLADGTIFDYINGGGRVYIDHGMEMTTHAVYTADDGTSMTLDIFDMANARNARAAFDDAEIAPQGYTGCSIGDACKAYTFEPDYIILFRSGRYLVNILLDDDTRSAECREFARTVAERLP